MNHLLPGGTRGGWQHGPVMDGIEHSNDGKTGKDYTSSHGRRAPHDIAPAGCHGGVATQPPHLKQHPEDGEKNKGISPEKHEFGHVCHSKRMRGSASV